MAVPSTRLLVLALVRILQPVHGYDVRRELLSWRADEWANVAQGSVYSALKTLQRDELISVEDVAQDGARPEKTRYRMTEQGEKEFRILLHDAVRSVEQPKFPYAPAIALMPFEPRDDVIAALRGRIAKLAVDIDDLSREADRILQGSGDPVLDEPYHVADSLRFHALHLEADLTWSRQTLARIESNELDVWSGKWADAKGFSQD
ncbi:PadR family transcriptional regulator [Antrihabitans cavernicola]|uniref:PadR family transcriptional regulator n=1 Tax=Antrihabitans cavernicola TaxID=2495913 RepID=A0A5A7SAL1_9NOCA|nr:PadR family transcriptional regulator [Spelaeibacter cavernicola]KAA0022524.1 PadR family transcriptional regulator [Spelaeibacter cavernicola]